MPYSVGMVSLGCEKNRVDAEIMMASLEKAGFVLKDDAALADVAIVNTCGFIESAKQESIEEILELARLKQEGRIRALVVTGCMAERYREEIRRELPEADAVCGIGANGEIAEIVKQVLEGEKPEIFLEKERLPLEGDRVRSTPSYFAYLKIAEGCDNRCAYCIIPDVRGPIRSRALEDVRREALALGAAGYREVVLTGIHLASYGRDFKDGISLLDAVEAVCAAPGVQRVRLGSLEPAWIDETYAARMAAQEKLCPQFHLSLQSGCDKVLGRMRRRYTTAQFRRAVAALRESFPGCAITTDVICGFAGETEQDFEETTEFCKEIGFARMHVFPYSEREGTPAVQFDGVVPVAEREERARRLIAVGKELENAYVRSLVGKTVEVMIEEEETGYCREYIRVRVPDSQPGEILKVKILAADGTSACGEKI